MSLVISFEDFTVRLRQYITVTSSPDHPDNSDADFDQLARHLFALQYANVPVYQRLCQNRGITPETLPHWHAIPAISTSAFKGCDLSSIPPNERTHAFHSSGTTGQNHSRHFHNNSSLAIYHASLLPWFQTHFSSDRDFPSRQSSPNIGSSLHSEAAADVRATGTSRSGLQPSDAKKNSIELIFLTPPPQEAPHSSLIHMFETIRVEYGGNIGSFVGKTSADGSWILDFDQLTQKLEAACSQNYPVGLFGTAFSFVHLLDHFEANKFSYRLPSGSRALETGGYKGRTRTLPKSGLHANITRRLAISETHILCEYGMSELSSQAYDRVIPSLRSSQRQLAQTSTLNKDQKFEPTDIGCYEIKENINRVFHFPPWARCRVISPETGREVAEGETGLLCIFDLANVYSVMAIQTEDLAVRRGSGFELVGRAPAAEPRGCSLMPASS